MAPTLHPHVEYSTNPIINHMRKTTTKILSLIAVLSGLATATHAQNIIVWQDDFNTTSLLSSNSTAGTFGAVAWNFPGAGVGGPIVICTNDLPGTNDAQNCAFIVNITNGVGLNFGWRSDWLPATGNTNTQMSAYTLQFDMAVQGVSLTNSALGYVGPILGLFANYGGLYYGTGGMVVEPASYFPTAGTGYQHFTIPLSSFVAADDTLMTPTETPLSFFIGFYMPSPTINATLEIDLANISVTMTNVPPPPTPTLTILPATPELRMFAQNAAATYNTEGFLTVDENQSWVGSVPGHPPTYSITYKDFNTVPGFVQQITFCPNNYEPVGDAMNTPYSVYWESNALALTIANQGTNGFTGSLDWRTNGFEKGNTNNVLLLTNSTGVGTWTLQFTNDTNGTLTPPGGSPVAFTLPAAMAAQFANPCTIYYGITPNSTGGYGQYIDLKSISITNVAGVNEYDDFTQDGALNTGLWDTGYSLDAGSVIQVSTTNTPFWVTWTIPDAGFGLETKNSLSDMITPWYSPTAWNGITPVTKLMGTSLKWTLMPTACLPPNLTNGNLDEGYLRLSNPPPSQ